MVRESYNIYSEEELVRASVEGDKNAWIKNDEGVKGILFLTGLLT